MKKYIGSVVPVFLCFCAFFTVVASLYGRDYRDWRDSGSWATTPSTSFYLVPRQQHAVYTYEVNGREYTNQRTHFFASDTASLRRDNWRLAHRDVEQVTVYYDPDHPQRSVLVPEADWVTVYQLPAIFVGVIILASAPVLMWLGVLWLWRRLMSR